MKTNIKLLLFSVSICIVTIGSAQNVIRFYAGGKVGYKNKLSGEIVVQPIYSAGSEMMADNTALVIEGRKRGFINEKGEVIIPFIYDDASVFFDGLARVMKDGKHGYINVKNETVIPF
ncbi:MAG: WG repeat-containing protein, partial [Bacteroidota bacterium]